MLHLENVLVCLERFAHVSGVKLEVRGEFQQTFRLIWDSEITTQMRVSWADSDENTEFAACGIAFLVVQALTDYVVIERARKGTGFDYWLADKRSPRPFQRSARLEVSGIGKADTEGEIRARVNDKIKQIERVKAKLPAYVVVVEFSRPIVQVVRREPDTGTA